MKTNPFLYLVCLLYMTMYSSCKLEDDQTSNPHQNHKMAQFDPQANVGRSAWQKPQLIVNKLGDLSDKTVVDIGAGSGFFSFRFAIKAKKVIALDIDQDMIDIIKLQQNNLPLEINQKIETRLVKPDDPALESGEADKVVIINTITYIDNKISYLKKIFDSQKPGDQILIVDFKKNTLPIDAPPITERMSADETVKVLQQAGYEVVEKDENTLEYQYIILADKSTKASME